MKKKIDEKAMWNKLLEHRGMSKYRLASNSNMTRQTLGRLINQGNVDAAFVETFHKVANGLDMTMDDLYDVIHYGNDAIMDNTRPSGLDDEPERQPDPDEYTVEGFDLEHYVSDYIIVHTDHVEEAIHYARQYWNCMCESDQKHEQVNLHKGLEDGDVIFRINENGEHDYR